MPHSELQAWGHAAIPRGPGSQQVWGAAISLQVGKLFMSRSSVFCCQEVGSTMPPMSFLFHSSPTAWQPHVFRHPFSLLASLKNTEKIPAPFSLQPPPLVLPPSLGRITAYGYLLCERVRAFLLVQFLLTQNHNYITVENIKMNTEK